MAGLGAFQKGSRRVLRLAFHVFHFQFKTNWISYPVAISCLQAVWWSICFNTSWMLRPELRWSLELGGPSQKFVVCFVLFFSWTYRVKPNDLSRVGPEPLLLCNCCSRDTGHALSRPPVEFGSGRLSSPPCTLCAVCVCDLLGPHVH